MPATHALGSVSAARIWGLPLPRQLEDRMETWVTVPSGIRPPDSASIHSNKLREDLMRIREVRGMRVLSPEVAWCQLYAVLKLDQERNPQRDVQMQLLAVADAMLTTFERYPGRQFSGKLSNRDALAIMARSWRGRPGTEALNRVVELARDDVESPGESRLRFRITQAGLPEPVVQHEVYEGWQFIARPDLSYPTLRIAIEYEGEHHFTKKQVLEDIQRIERLQELGWIVIRVTYRDIWNPVRILRRVEGALALRAA